MGPCSLFHNLFPEAVYRSFPPPSLPRPTKRDASQVEFCSRIEQSMRVAKIFFSNSCVGSLKGVFWVFKFYLRKVNSKLEYIWE